MIAFSKTMQEALGGTLPFAKGASNSDAYCEEIQGKHQTRLPYLLYDFWKLFHVVSIIVWVLGKIRETTWSSKPTTVPGPKRNLCSQCSLASQRWSLQMHCWYKCTCKVTWQTLIHVAILLEVVAQSAYMCRICALGNVNALHAVCVSVLLRKRWKRCFLPPLSRGFRKFLCRQRVKPTILSLWLYVRHSEPLIDVDCLIDVGFKPYGAHTHTNAHSS